ncbi:MAG: hypothetical protein JRI39_00445 [Deltaproteobacteria bacterium]|nr:hypothetical protein [Deltaproteobacteria bacterium]
MEHVLECQGLPNYSEAILRRRFSRGQLLPEDLIRYILDASSWDIVERTIQRWLEEDRQEQFQPSDGTF